MRRAARTAAEMDGNAGAPSPWGSVERLLAIRLDNLGDVLMVTPAIAALRASLPRARITLLASPACAAVRRHFVDVDDAIPFRAPWVRHESGGDEDLGVAEAALVERLRRERFDAAVIFTSCSQSPLPAALLCRLAAIPLRLAHCRENPYGLLSDWVPETDVIGDGMRHEVARQLDLVGSVGFRSADPQLRFEVLESDRQAVAARLASAGGDHGGPWVVVHPGASAPSRRYPAARFGAAAEAIARSTGARIVFTGGPDEIELVEQGRRAMAGPSISFAGMLSLGELAALISIADLLVANNSGPAHVAAAVGTPVVDLYALTNPQHTPWRVPARVLNRDVPCRHCLKSRCPQGHHACLLGVPPAAVASAAVELLVATRDLAARPVAEGAEA